MKIRRMKIEDAPGIFEVRKKNWLDIYPNKTHNITHNDIAKLFADEKKLIAKIKKDIASHDSKNRGWVAEVHNKIIGFTTTYSDDNRDIVGAIYILPEYQHKGIGSKLLQKILDFKKHSKELWVEVACYNNQAIDFYKKHKFRIVPKSEGKQKLTGKKYIPTIEMKRNITKHRQHI